uniref:Uncharacterized protein n=1 Tax=viral metagenome TaxID=1070528 RepID=A0A6M3KW11_9ZZZZ
MTLNRPRPQWKDREHLFTPNNIAKFEFVCGKAGHCIYKRPMKCKIAPKPLPNGPVKHLMNKGVYLFLSAEEEFYEELLMIKGPQLPEDRLGEPESFYLGKEKDHD